VLCIYEALTSISSRNQGPRTQLELRSGPQRIVYKLFQRRLQAYCKLTNSPPSTNNCAPVCVHALETSPQPSRTPFELTTYRLNSLPKNTAGPAKSSGSPVLPSGMRPSIYSLFLSSFRSSSLSCVRIVPGSRALHLMLYFPSAHAHDWISDSTPAFVGV